MMARFEHTVAAEVVAAAVVAAAVVVAVVVAAFAQLQRGLLLRQRDVGSCFTGVYKQFVGGARAAHRNSELFRLEPSISKNEFQ